MPKSVQFYDRSVSPAANAAANLALDFQNQLRREGGQHDLAELCFWGAQAARPLAPAPEQLAIGREALNAIKSALQPDLGRA